MKKVTKKVAAPKSKAKSYKDGGKTGAQLKDEGKKLKDQGTILKAYGKSFADRGKFSKKEGEIASKKVMETTYGRNKKEGYFIENRLADGTSQKKTISGPSMSHALRNPLDVLRASDKPTVTGYKVTKNKFDKEKPTKKANLVSFKKGGKTTTKKK